MIFALHLVESLQENGLKFIFKGGTSLVLLMDNGNRFSIDIDIICNIGQEDLELVLNKVIATSRFKSFKLDEYRSYKEGVPKAHYKFHFDSGKKGSGTILLDVLIEDSLYPELIEKPVQTKWIETEGETLIQLPNIESISGDKLTAFAPNTTGIPYFKGKDKQPFAMEICKQLFDLSMLFERIQNLKIVRVSFLAFAEKEIEYRKKINPEFKTTPDEILQDIIDTCLLLAKRGKGSEDEKWKYAEMHRGIKAFGTGFLMSGSFRIDDAITASARIAYLAAKLLVNDMSPINYFKDQDINDLYITDHGWSYLNKLKGLSDGSAFYYWHHTVILLST